MELYELTSAHPGLTYCLDTIPVARDLLVNTYRAGGKLLLCGNGGSAADCDHIAGELLKGFLSPRPLSEEEEDALPDDEAMAPESQAVAEAEEQWLWKRLEQVLTDFEVSCLRCHLEGYSYEESAVALRTDSKAVDNALQRARRKLRKRLGAQPDFFRFDR